MRWFNQIKTAGEPWSDAELAHKLRDAKAEVDAAGEFGRRLAQRSADQCVFTVPAFAPRSKFRLVPVAGGKAVRP